MLRHWAADDNGLLVAATLSPQAGRGENEKGYASFWFFSGRLRTGLPVAA